MSQPNAFLHELLSSIPADWHEPVEALAAEVLHPNTPLRLVLLGGFSVGKSSMLNMLLQEHLLQTALEETTALPTFIEHATERGMSLIGQDGSQLPLDEAQFAHVTTHAPQGLRARCWNCLSHGSRGLHHRPPRPGQYLGSSSRVHLVSGAPGRRCAVPAQPAGAVRCRHRHVERHSAGRQARESSGQSLG